MNGTHPNNLQMNKVELIRFGHHFKAIKKNWLSIAAFTLLFSLTCTWYIYSKASIYQATATLLIQEEQKSALSIEEVYGVDTTKKEYFQTQIAILKSNHIADKVIRELNLTQLPEFTSSGGLNKKIDQIKSIPFVQDLLNVAPSPKETAQFSESYYQALQAFRSKLDIEPVRNTQLVRIRFRSTDPKLATTIANAVGQAYIDANFEAKLVVTQNAATWLTNNSQKLEERLRNSEQALQEFLLKEGLIDINGIDEIYANELEELTRKLNIAVNKRIEAQTLIQLLRRKSSQSLDSLLSIDEFANQAQIRDLKLSEAQAAKNLSELAQRYGPKHDRMIQAKAQLAEIQSRTQQLIRDISFSKQQDLLAAKAQEDMLRAELDNKKSDFQSLGSQKARYEQLKREVESNKALYEAFLNREKETNATSDYKNVTARFTDKAIIPLFPVAPQRIKLVLIATFFGFAIACALVIILETMREVIRSTADVQEKLGVTCLGVIPMVKKRNLRKNGVSYTAYLDDEEKLFSEACRSVRTSLLLRLTNTKQKILPFTSAIPEEGKTSTSINMAVSFSKMEKVLIIDCDLRRPSIAKRFGIAESSPGLTHILTMDTPIKDCVTHIKEANLDVLSAGLIPPNPQELLASDRFKKLLEHFQNKYDRIIIDTPPLLSVSDALILGQYANGLITVIRSESTKSSLVNLALSKQIQHSVPSLGVLITQAKAKEGETLYVQKYAY
ncbi:MULTISPECIES: GumC family protein [Vibrio]|jgi:capsular exopolysaccharide synthesis family protein|uniref:GumC family protein n=1 Tax=Vibrio TaxID=662 RepID=UPI0001BDFFD0|nr:MULTISPECIES: polysaccharide biosynthesis tyrosine autokinase [Vibrio]EEZ83064.1 putative exopolysaccharide biosynthesis protein [Vibrio alginolyticus 40B]MDG2785188.1 polysaccharide biosynthesis tyrosine autokinase [Vibrio parahaemolyticus]EIL8370011.1 polysaccharide biosynthesis tyrosine autokinase [Vibrio alginolyticus]EIO9262809.1 polysaccharide biosynthesis tyrosine autokinase [Vibrio alginolyticus]EJE3288825.1 polysaccharide biosynthesis tyrosine autokinase [Vibrio alginolyticus]